MSEPKKRIVLAIEDVESRERTIRREWSERVYKKLDRIKGEGYGKRQIEDTLSKVEKIRTEL